MSQLYLDAEEIQKELKRSLGRRYSQVRKVYKRSYKRVLKPLLPFIRAAKLEHERQAKELALLLKEIESLSSWVCYHSSLGP